MVETIIAISVDSELCKGCNLCIENCPREVLATSRERGTAGFLVPEAINPQACTRCLMCELICPDFAIVVKG